ncbi:hypothetical protein ATE92_1684 [Ulvibacter sp. MAR_2010_11]|uniref:hypothetical protein n=1 Tax=Ulvibacter sp. MAR_2010_11 TaxID=1250229 RepID=UPI000C2C3B98|nr:hypothetical protein [Ulvibacter sp. MAR_2010_11]PKA83529.1 hypothetical protein ATE92_1684 [Ulvibacter sp. MAR_2010_11]
MKFKSIPFLISILLISPFFLIAQADADSQAYWVHEDPVYPAKVADYEGYCTTLADNCTKYNVKEAKWVAVSTDDLRYFHLSPIVNMADLDKSRFSLLRDKMGESEFNELFDNFDNCYDTHFDYIIHLDNNLSYMPKDVRSTQVGMEFRKLEFWYVTPQNFPKVLALAKEFKDLYAEKNSKEYYQLFRSGFGAVGQFILVSIPARNPEDYERVRKENKELLGEARTPVYEQLLKLITRVETLNGYIRADLSYDPEKQ